ncbi:MAG: protein-tyrosine-phosphatase [Thermoflexibacter sp.]|jgi:protein-tyrosine-phosphatase|nr:protein-tyrosine-phosphatase [Thermoflexibacter sp.]
MKTLIFSLILIFYGMQVEKTILFPELQTYCNSLESEFSQISEDRKENLKKIAQFISEKYKKGETVNLTFICTHNSRRSQFGQVWAKVAAAYYGLNLEKIQTYSGGTEATACNPRTVAALQRAGIKVETMNQISAPATVANNPRYEVRFAEKTTPFFLFSKKYSDEQNPQKNYGAILVCSQADEACPVVFGADARIYHGYEDPKKSDGTPEETQTYDATCRLIARELFYVFGQVER